MAVPSAIRIVPYDAAWPVQYEEERARIAEALAESAVAIEHIGSTAVPGLGAKPTLDLMVGLRSMDDGERCQSLEAQGYEALGEFGIPGRLYFRKPRRPPRTHHVHVVRHGGEFWERHLRFRDLLRGDAELARNYEELKQGLAQRFATDPEAYTDGKTGFIEAALAAD